MAAAPGSSPPPPPAARPVLHGYGPGRFRISGALWQGSVLILPERALPWPVSAAGEANVESLAPLFALPPGTVELLLLGSGPSMAMPPAGLRPALRAAGIGLEVMDTGAACRTLSVLLAEDRLVAAALIAL